MSATSRSRKSRISRGTGSKKTSRGKRRLGSTSSRLGRVPRASLYVGTKHGKATLLAKATRKGFDTLHGPFADPAEARYFRDRFNAEDYAPLVYDHRGVARLERNGRRRRTSRNAERQIKVYGVRNHAYGSNIPAGGHVRWYPTKRERDAYLAKLREMAVKHGLARSAAVQGIRPIVGHARLSEIGY